MKHLMFSFLALCLAFPVQAQSLDAAQFEEMTTGRTLVYNNAFGQPYGIEWYLPGRRVFWQFLGEACKGGTWSPGVDGQICFDYEGAETVQCWVFENDGSALSARYSGSSPDFVELGLERIEADLKAADADMFCSGFGS